MRDAVKDGATLASPAIGTWRPAVGLGAPLVPGMVLGRLVRVGRPLDVVAPAGVAGVAVHVAPAGAAVQWGDPVVRMGEGGMGAFVDAPVAEVADAPAGAVAVRADTDGTVYLRPEPGAAAFAVEGAQVVANATLALVEVMKTFTPVRAPSAGVVARVDVADGASIEAGTVLLWLRPPG